MIAIKNLLFQPLTFQLAGGGQGLHLGPRERREISDEHVSAEIRTAAQRGLVTLTEIPVPPKASPKARRKTAAAAKTPSKAASEKTKSLTPRRRKSGGKS